jgi:hypothetical protein
VAQNPQNIPTILQILNAANQLSAELGYEARDKFTALNETNSPVEIFH